MKPSVTKKFRYRNKFTGNFVSKKWAKQHPFWVLKEIINR